MLILTIDASNAVPVTWVTTTRCNSTPEHDVEWSGEWALLALKMTPCIGQTYTTTPIHNIKNVFHQTPNRHYHWPVTCHAVWRMARLENRRRARQAAIPPWVSASSLRSKDTRMRLLNGRKVVAPSRSGNPPNGSILVGGGKETNRDSLSSSERNGNSPNRIPYRNVWEM